MRPIKSSQRIRSEEGAIGGYCQHTSYWEPGVRCCTALLAATPAVNFLFLRHIVSALKLMTLSLKTDLAICSWKRGNGLLNLASGLESKSGKVSEMGFSTSGKMTVENDAASIRLSSHGSSPASSHTLSPASGHAVWAAIKSILMIAFLLGLSTPQVEAARHPALDPNVTAAKCIECHADKTSDKSAHAKGSVNCLSCHEVRANKDVTRVKLITPTPAALCFTCHKDKNPANITGFIHAPNAHDCLKCHDPHKSDNPALLLKPMSGDQGKNLCLDCHDIGVHVAKGGSRHPALDSGCDTCHIIHKSGDPHQREFQYHMTKDAPALCLDCHDVKDEKLVKAHHGQPFETADCIQCHDPRSSDSPHLMQTFQHDPFKSEEACPSLRPTLAGLTSSLDAQVKSEA